MAVSKDRARRAQRKIVRVATIALQRLERELEEHPYQPTEDWCKRFKIVADQLRRDWPKQMPTEQDEGDRGTSGGSSAAPPADPFRGLKLKSVG